MPLDERATFPQRVPKPLKARIDAAANERGLSVNAYVTMVLDRYVPPLPAARGHRTES